MATQPRPKYQHVFDQLSREILNEKYAAGQKFPSEAALVKRFGLSRITIGRALRELQQRGLVDRIAGSGTYVRAASQGSRSGLLFGLIIPDLGETEIFEPICQGIAGSHDAAGHALLWAHSDSTISSKGEQVLELCRQCIARSVSGVFFAPLELSAGSEQVNRRVLKLLKDSKIPVVLLDRRPDEPSGRERCDLVGIDNHRAGFMAAEHLLKLGARRIGFVSFEYQASTVKGRISGYRDALSSHGRSSAGELIFAVDEALDFEWKRGKYDAFVCANDRLAGLLMQTLLAGGVRIPQDVRIVGIDDVAYASLLPIPLTTIHQPCRDIGEAALRVMLERLERPKAPARNVLLDCSLVIRKSCGAR
jgi:DNA-binding LacI/PurR family transcriptional regulator